MKTIPKASVLFLRECGYDLLWIGEEHASIQDNEIINLAEKEQRLIVTLDKDYGTLIFRMNYKPPSGVLFLRLDNYGPEDPGRVTHQLLQTAELAMTNRLTVYDRKSIRQRTY